jgi:hypothetical protein
VPAQVAQTSLRAVTGRSDMDQLLSGREKVNAELRQVIDEPTEQPWGIRVERVEVKDVSFARGELRPNVSAAHGSSAPTASIRRPQARPGCFGHGRRPGRPAAAAAADRR